MATLYLDRSSLELRADGAALALYDNGERVRSVPLRVLDRVVVQGDLLLSANVLTAMVESGASVVFLGRRSSERIATVLGGAHGDARIRLTQFARAQEPAFRTALAQRLLQAKLAGQARLLAEALAGRPDLRKPLTDSRRGVVDCLAKLRAGGDGPGAVARMMGLEGAASAAYLPGLCALFPESLGFTGRNRRPPRDPVNACLSLGYTIIHHEAVACCHAAGLDPFVGFLQEPAFGRESLACDLVEPVRPMVDRWVWGLFRDRVLRAEHFALDHGACRLHKAGRQRFYVAYAAFVGPRRSLLRRIARLVVRSLGGEFLARPATADKADAEDAF